MFLPTILLQNLIKQKSLKPLRYRDFLEENALKRPKVGNAVARESFGLHWHCCLFDEPDPEKRGKALTLDEYAARPHVVVHYGGTFGVAECFLRRLGHRRRVDVMTSHYAEVPQYLLGTDRIALVPVHTAKCFLERFPTLAVCEIPFHTSQDSVELSYQNDLF